MNRLDILCIRSKLTQRLIITGEHVQILNDCSKQLILPLQVGLLIKSPVSYFYCMLAMVM
jgi:hypothetical protein